MGTATTTIILEDRYSKTASAIIKKTQELKSELQSLNLISGKLAMPFQGVSSSTKGIGALKKEVQSLKKELLSNLQPLTELNAFNFDTNIANTTKSLNGFVRNFKGFASKISSILRQISKFKGLDEGIKVQIAEVTKSFKALAMQMNTIPKSITQIKKSSQGFSQAISGLNSLNNIDEKGLKALKRVTAYISKIPASLTEIKKSSQGFNKAISGLNSLNAIDEKGLKALDKNLSKLAISIPKFLPEIEALIKKLKNIDTRSGNKFDNLAKSLDVLRTSIDGLSKGVDKIKVVKDKIDSLRRVCNSMRSLPVVNLASKIQTKGMTTLLEYANNVNKLRTQLTKLPQMMSEVRNMTAINLNDLIRGNIDRELQQLRDLNHELGRRRVDHNKTKVGDGISKGGGSQSIEGRQTRSVLGDALYTIAGVRAIDSAREYSKALFNIQKQLSPNETTFQYEALARQKARENGMTVAENLTMIAELQKVVPDGLQGIANTIDLMVYKVGTLNETVEGASKSIAHQQMAFKNSGFNDPATQVRFNVMMDLVENVATTVKGSDISTILSTIPPGLTRATKYMSPEDMIYIAASAKANVGSMGNDTVGRSLGGVLNVMSKRAEQNNATVIQEIFKSVEEYKKLAGSPAKQDAYVAQAIGSKDMRKLQVARSLFTAFAELDLNKINDVMVAKSLFKKGSITEEMYTEKYHKLNTSEKMYLGSYSTEAQEAQERYSKTQRDKQNSFDTVVNATIENIKSISDALLQTLTPSIQTVNNIILTPLSEYIKKTTEAYPSYTSALTIATGGLVAFGVASAGLKYLNFTNMATGFGQVSKALGTFALQLGAFGLGFEGGKNFIEKIAGAWFEHKQDTAIRVANNKTGLGIKIDAVQAFEKMEKEGRLSDKSRQRMNVLRQEIIEEDSSQVNNKNTQGTANLSLLERVKKYYNTGVYLNDIGYSKYMASRPTPPNGTVNVQIDVKGDAKVTEASTNSPYVTINPPRVEPSSLRI